MTSLTLKLVLKIIYGWFWIEWVTCLYLHQISYFVFLIEAEGKEVEKDIKRQPWPKNSIKFPNLYYMKCRSHLHHKNFLWTKTPNFGRKLGVWLGQTFLRCSGDPTESNLMESKKTLKSYRIFTIRYLICPYRHHFYSFLMGNYFRLHAELSFKSKTMTILRSNLLLVFIYENARNRT